ncbi:MAG: serine acetyltransferase [Phycisphaerae bacterium]|nr:serine acetyltransferase [Phycisphaerae bacterium]
MNERTYDIRGLVEAIVASYRADERTHRIGQTALPSRERIVETAGQLRQLVFCGYFGHKRLGWDDVGYHIGSLVRRLAEELTDEIAHCLSSVGRHEGNPQAEACRAEAAELAEQFLARIARAREALALDAQAAYDGDPAAKSIDEVIYSYPGFYAVTIYRLAHELADLSVPLMPRIMTEHAHSVTGADIHPAARIGRRFFIDHATGVVIGETSRIGDNVKCYQGVTLGAKSFPKDERGRLIKGLQRHPTIEDRVTIYPNATVLGGETVIGEGATIGGNAYITSSIPPHTLVKQKDPELEMLPKRGG